ncbi:MAG: M48 family metalloprotease [Oceanidesulfovibrio sp.]
MPYPIRTHPRRLLALALAVALFIQLSAGLAFAQFDFDFSLKDEKELGRKLAVLIKTRVPLVEDPIIVDYCRGVVEKLVDAMPPQPFDIEVYVIRHSAVNAFAAPAGHVFIHSGLILNFEKESELAGVLAHELAHVSERHVAERIEQMQKVSLLSLLGALAGMFIGGEVGEGLVVGSQAASASAMLKYTRDNETEADRIGMNYLVGAGYPARGLLESFEKLQVFSRLSSGNTIPTYLSTHPGIDERIGYMDSLLDRMNHKAYEDEDNSQFLRMQALLRAHYTDPKSALQHFSQKESKTPCLDAMGRGIALTRMNRYKEAEVEFDEALQCGASDSLVYRETGRFAFAKGDFRKAGYLLERASIMDPDDLMALFFLARLLGDEGEYERSAQLFERILRAIPEDPEVHFHYGRMLGAARRLFGGHLHLAYSALYAEDKRQFEFHKDKASRHAASPEDTRELEELQAVYDERKEYWNG